MFVLLYILGYIFALIEMIRTYMYIMRTKWGKGYEIMVCPAIYFFTLLAFTSWVGYFVFLLIRKERETRYGK